jgi:hypothetical protein
VLAENAQSKRSRGVDCFWNEENAVVADYPFPKEGLFKISPIIRLPNHRYLQAIGKYEPRLSARKWEITMRKTILAAVGASIIAVLTAQAAAAASGHHRTRTNHRAIATEQFRNSNNAYAAPSNVAAQPGWSGYDGAMGSGMVGH